ILKGGVNADIEHVTKKGEQIMTDISSLGAVGKIAENAQSVMADDTKTAGEKISVFADAMGDALEDTLSLPAKAVDAVIDTAGAVAGKVVDGVTGLAEKIGKLDEQS
ncbi:MAG: hypothetical protein LUG16_01280, partial [Candidatus Gastranaerophilales bacterium]|nr:hypothetical protein [Candidatus Gastranaerophilales bacterium]